MKLASHAGVRMRGPVRKKDGDLCPTRPAGAVGGTILQGKKVPSGYDCRPSWEGEERLARTLIRVGASPLWTSLA